MDLQVEERSGAKKSEAKQLRRAGKIPAIVYAKSGDNRKVAIDRREFETHLRQIKKGCLSTTTFKLAGVEAIVKDIQYNITSYDVIHLDFQELDSKTEVTVNVPVHIIGGADSPGVKLGGVVRHVIRALRVKCLPGKIPAELTVDVSDLDIGGVKRLRDIALPEGVTSLAKMGEVVVVIAKR